jgi:protein-S-isoprenylcysteine O-methyltransferase Ste14
MDLSFLVSAALITLYFVVGSRLEEHKLIVDHGEAYARYRLLVPSLIPSRG